MSFNDGEFVKVDYTAWRESDGAMVYTTEKKRSEASPGAYAREGEYRPDLVVIGKRFVTPGLENAIKQMAVGETRTVEVGSAEAYGERDPERVRVMRASDFKREKIDPEPGRRVEIDGMTATVTSVNSGRVTVDANHPLAGEKMRYEVKVVAKIDGEKEKIAALAEMANIKIKGVRSEGSKAEIDFGEMDADEKPEERFLHSSQKRILASAVLDYIPGISSVVEKEEYARQKEAQK